MIYPEDRLIIFERKRYIGHKQFIRHFTNGFNNYFEREGLLEIQFIQREEEVETVLSEAEKIPSAEFKVEPTNPDYTEDSEFMDRELRKINAEKGNISVENEEEGLNYDEGNLFASAVALVIEGYGRFKIKYLENGEEKTLTSDDTPAKKEVDKPQSPLEFRDTIPSLRRFIGDIIDVGD